MNAIAEALRAVGGALATVVSLPFRLIARVFGALGRGPRRRV